MCSHEGLVQISTFCKGANIRSQLFGQAHFVRIVLSAGNQAALFCDWPIGPIVMTPGRNSLMEE